ncbi:DUF1592 domain-containing protein [Armatimonas sp.]|uniref:DUF1592 domain-containing protein n=1 Tax=Armatimonas sp. TaxID=1872638 RepID=UPI00286AA460|nr:DUF1592 domain-containing protein [Armatimonas sp.]
MKLQKRQRKLSGRLASGAVLTLGLGALSAAMPQSKPSVPATSVQAFLKANCIACHNPSLKEGKLDLTALPLRLDDPKIFATWVKVHDRVQLGEMPPPAATLPKPAARAAFLKNLAAPMQAVEAARVKREGRAVWRRMNRYEYENTVRDLLGAPWLQLKFILPEDGVSARFNKVGTALDVSHVQMSRYLDAANVALKEVLAQGVARPETTTRRYYAREQRSFAGLVEAGFAYSDATARATFPILGEAADLPVLEKKGPMTVGEKDPDKREREALGVVASAYEPIQPEFDRFHAPVSGRYRLRLRAYSFWSGADNEKQWWRASRTKISRGRTQEPVTLYATSHPQQQRRLGTVDTGPDPAVRELDVQLLKGESILPDAARLFRSRPPADDPKRKITTGWHTPLATKEGQPGVAFQWLEVEGPLYDTWPIAGVRLLCGDLPVKAVGGGQLEIIPKDPEKDGARLLRGFLPRALRRPVQPTDVLPYEKLFQSARRSGASFTEALLAAYSGILCSPDFITLEEKPGPLSDFALATRLSYFLWNTEPDETLRSLATQGRLKDPKVLAAQTERLLADPRSRRFVEAFLDYWLDLRKTADVSPDETLYADYYLDDYLVESAVEETQAFFRELLHKNLPARNIVSSDFVTVNDRLATLYNLPNVQGATIRRVPLPKDSVRGGLLTQASVLKVTANGTTTSPVLRGVWINERILGLTVPPPPASVPAVEPDIRGATTIRELLAKHRTQPECRSCHTKIDPAGFALESFDVFGGWRDRYRGIGEKDGKVELGFGKNGQPFYFHAAQPVDSSGTLPDGRRFADIREMKRLLGRDERGIARNLARQLVTYATGAPVQFGDQAQLEAILSRAQPSGYGVKSLLHQVIASDLFRNK